MATSKDSISVLQYFIAFCVCWLGAILLLFFQLPSHDWTQVNYKTHGEVRFGLTSYQVNNQPNEYGKESPLFIRQFDDAGETTELLLILGLSFMLTNSVVVLIFTIVYFSFPKKAFREQLALFSGILALFLGLSSSSFITVGITNWEYGSPTLKELYDDMGREVFDLKSPNEDEVTVAHYGNALILSWMSCLLSWFHVLALVSFIYHFRKHLQEMEEKPKVTHSSNSSI